MDILGEQGSPVPILLDPFNKSSVRCITLYIDRRNSALFDFQANVEFSRGDTCAKQVVRAENFDDLVKQIRMFLSNLKENGK